MSFKSFFTGVWNGFTGVFKGGADLGKCLTSWNTNVTIFRQNRFPIFTKNWWGASFKNKWNLLTDWWNELGCMQKIMYCVAGFVFMILFGGFLFLGSDFILDFEDFGTFFDSMISAVTGTISIIFDWSAYFMEFVFLTVNPAYHFVTAISATAGFSALPTYIIVAECTLILFMLFYRYVYAEFIFNAKKKHTKTVKIFGVLNYPFKEFSKAIAQIFGGWLSYIFDIAMLPARVLMIIVSTLLGDIF